MTEDVIIKHFIFKTLSKSVSLYDIKIYFELEVKNLQFHLETDIDSFSY